MYSIQRYPGENVVHFLILNHLFLHCHPHIAASCSFCSATPKNLKLCQSCSDISITIPLICSVCGPSISIVSFIYSLWMACICHQFKCIATWMQLKESGYDHNYMHRSNVTANESLQNVICIIIGVLKYPSRCQHLFATDLMAFWGKEGGVQDVWLFV